MNGNILVLHSRNCGGLPRQAHGVALRATKASAASLGCSFAAPGRVRASSQMISREIGADSDRNRSIDVEFAGGGERTESSSSHSPAQTYLGQPAVDVRQVHDDWR
jgi:hypothetical protein